ncbi:MAG: hypothetical protein NBV68_04575 [Erythrobacter sp.]|uniref:hypothetical protein n=1 Tax=Erythrobacter sp. TaxID=1042 RepID=UPI0025F95324|nr:hypothetical protein [Erythrobacter sp.]MCL9998633.1 hypothetical protein [Erythrobacter sp.]
MTVSASSRPKADSLKATPLWSSGKSVINIVMGFFSDFRIFERPPKPGPRLFRWIAWRWLALGFLFTSLILVFAISHFIGGEPIYYVNEKRNLTDAEAWDMILMFLSGGGFFFIAGLLGVLYLPEH